METEYHPTGRPRGRYEVVSLLGSGFIGEVYRGRDTTLDREVALKLMPSVLAHDPERAARFRREAKLPAALNHARIAAVHGFEEVDGLSFLVMELVDGDGLA